MPEVIVRLYDALDKLSYKKSLFVFVEKRREEKIKYYFDKRTNLVTWVNDAGWLLDWCILYGSLGTLKFSGGVMLNFYIPILWRIQLTKIHLSLVGSLIIFLSFKVSSFRLFLFVLFMLCILNFKTFEFIFFFNLILIIHIR